jgi:hypothetical protein
MRRRITWLAVVLAILSVAQIRLSRSEHRWSEPPPPALWENAYPPGSPAPEPIATRSERGLQFAYASPSTNCVALISTDRDSSFALTSAEDGVLFDIDADGDRDRVAWTEPSADVSFLALDRDGDGRITSGRELIGDRTMPGLTNGPNALRQLATYPGTWGSVDSANPLFAALRLWTDVNHDGRSEKAELRPVDSGLSAIGLGYERHRRMDGHGNQSRYRGFVHIRTAAGTNRPATAEDDRIRRRFMYEVCLVTR